MVIFSKYFVKENLNVNFQAPQDIGLQILCMDSWTCMVILSIVQIIIFTT